MRVIVTRPSKEAQPWVAALQEAGYDAVSVPLITIAGTTQLHAVHDAWRRWAEFDAVMFVSGNAVEHFYASKPDVAPVDTAQAAIKTRAYVTGPGTYAALVRARFPRNQIDAPSREAAQFDSEALWAVVRGQMRPGFRLLVVRGASAFDGVGQSTEGQGRDWFSTQVQAAGGVVEWVVAYQRQRPHWSAQDHAHVRAAATDGSVWLFSSSEAIANLRALCPSQDWTAARAVVTHARIGQAAKAAGFGVVRESRPALASLLASIESLQ